MAGKGKEVATPSAYKITSLCIIAGTNLGKDESFSKAAKLLGKEMAARKINVVYGGGIQGLGANVASTALTKGSKVLSIVLDNVAASSNPIFSLGRELKVANTQARVNSMIQCSNAFIIMPGGMDNVEFFSTLMLWADSNIHNKPIGFLNVKGFFDGFLDFLVRVGDQKFIPRRICNQVVAASTAGQLIDLLQSLAQAPNPPMNPMIPNTGDKRKREEPDLDLKL